MREHQLLMELKEVPQGNDIRRHALDTDAGKMVVRTFTVARTNAELLEDSEGFGGLLHGAATSRRLILAVIIGTVILVLFKYFR
ncbi:hypothetical protein HPB52_022799 [Rhipicephalus sanguineus]|uniref:Uncharacterized protein n=1 Tax=Rhipicephalus sanguineus TaxID=34632 RepID=A0A9D4T810_RHISA|nr:hypothetical protein HPB52_022799 [Rhipicephalus sanguineus]